MNFLIQSVSILTSPNRSNLFGPIASHESYVGGGKPRWNNFVQKKRVRTNSILDQINI